MHASIDTINFTYNHASATINTIWEVKEAIIFMAEIKDFHCTYDNSAGIQGEVTKGLNLTFPDAYLHAETMVLLSKALKEHDGAAFCELPFCHTVEAEALGGSINYGNDKTGPRAKEYICSSVEELLNLPSIDFTKGRIQEVLKACKSLSEQGEHVVFEVSGPFTILNVLIDAKYVFKAMRKQQELMLDVFHKLGEEILQFMKAAKNHGASFISYADSSGGVNILGPRLAGQVAEGFTYGFLKEAEQLADEETMILLCPKTTFAMLGIEKAVFDDLKLSGVKSYGEACIEMLGKAKFAGQMCIKNTGYQLENGIFKAVTLL